MKRKNILLALAAITVLCIIGCTTNGAVALALHVIATILAVALGIKMQISSNAL